jgi:hypothetical protein
VADGICNNCGATLAGEFCHCCGQREADTDWRSFDDIARQFWDELVSLDFTSARTVGALFRPGRLAGEFIAGRRRRYLSPLKTYLLAAALFFLIAPRVTDFTFERQMALDREGKFRALVEARITETGVSRELFAERFGRTLQTVYTLSPILSVLVLTLLLRAFFGKVFHWLGPHLVFALYYVAFLYGIHLLLHAVNQRFQAPNIYILLVLQFGVLVPYLSVALRRVYGQPSRVTLAKTLGILALAFVIDSPINVAAVWLSVALT